jgi:hypothetical protein
MYDARAMRVWWMVPILMLAACDRMPWAAQETSPELDAQRGHCRQACGEAYKACTRDCANDAPQACESRCDARHQKCNDACAR